MTPTRTARPSSPAPSRPTPVTQAPADHPQPSPKPVDPTEVSGLLRIVPEACTFRGGNSEATIVISHPYTVGRNGPRPLDALQSVDAKNLAIAYAAKHGMTNVTLNLTATSTYPVDAAGKVLTSLNDPTRPAVAYRTEIGVRQGR